MKIAALSVLVACIIPACGLAGDSETLDLVLPHDKQRIRVEIVVEREAPGARWNAFLANWIDYFDTDGDGVLSRDEASRIFPVPMPDRKSVPFDFTKADADNNGKVTPAELKAFYRIAGFTPVLGLAVPPSLENLQIADALFRHLGPDAGGKLRSVNAKQTAQLLRILDEDEDEVLTTAEVLSLGVAPALKAPSHADFQWAIPANQPPDARIRLVLDDSAAPTLRIEPLGKSLHADLATSPLRIRHEQAVLACALDDSSPGKAVANSRQFVLAQFRNVAGKAPFVEKSQVADDPSLQVLADIFPHADRNHDGKLARAELERFLALIEQGVNCPLVVTIADCGRNLFCHLDSNADGRLDLQELLAAPGRVAALGGAAGWTRSQIPHYVQVTLQRGFAGDAFGPLPLASQPGASKGLIATRSAKGPAWFRAMDKNGDGFLSPREFLGPLGLFQRLDCNGDGMISIQEAEQADAKRGMQ